MYTDRKIWIAKSQLSGENLFLLPKMANRHGLIAGATGTGKTVTMKVLAESFSDAGVPVFVADAKGDLFVMCGSMRMFVNVKDIKIDYDAMPAEKPGTSGTYSGALKMEKSLSISAEINLLGMTTDEAVSAVSKYLDDAYVAHMSPVRIVHGKGTGALRNAVHSYLRKQKNIAEFRLGEYGEGDAGVTIVKFK